MGATPNDSSSQPAPGIGLVQEVVSFEIVVEDAPTKTTENQSKCSNFNCLWIFLVSWFLVPLIIIPVFSVLGCKEATHNAQVGPTQVAFDSESSGPIADATESTICTPGFYATALSFPILFYLVTVGLMIFSCFNKKMGTTIYWIVAVLGFFPTMFLGISIGAGGSLSSFEIRSIFLGVQIAVVYMWSLLGFSFFVCGVVNAKDQLAKVQMKREMQELDQLKSQLRQHLEVQQKVQHPPATGSATA